MNTRIKTVYPTNEIPHLWAHQSVPLARNKQGSVSFDGSRMFSYSTVIAVRIERKGDRPLFVLNDGDFSRTTSKQQCYVHRAANNLGDTILVRGLDKARPSQKGWELRLAASLTDAAAAKYTEAARHRDGTAVQNQEALRAQEWVESARTLLSMVKRGKGLTALMRALTQCSEQPLGALKERAAHLRAVAAPRRAAALTADLRTHWETAQNTTRGAGYRLIVAHRVRRQVDDLLAPVWHPESNDYQTPRLPRGVPSRETVEQLIAQLRVENYAAQQAEREAQFQRAWRSAEMYMHTGSYGSARHCANSALQLCTRAESWAHERVSSLLHRARRRMAADDVLARVGHLEKLDVARWGEYEVRLYTRIVADVVDWPPGHPMRARLCALEPKASEATQSLAAKRAQQVDDWRAGKRLMMDTSAPLLRLHEGVVETSWGARVPAESARRLWSLLAGLRGRDAQCASLTERLVAQGYRVGNYPLDEIRSDGSLKIGCHDIAASEVDYIAKQLGLV